MYFKWHGGHNLVKFKEKTRDVHDSRRYHNTISEMWQQVTLVDICELCSNLFSSKVWVRYIVHKEENEENDFPDCLQSWFKVEQ